jgi:hypothetical protein
VRVPAEFWIESVSGPIGADADGMALAVNVVSQGFVARGLLSVQIVVD